LTVKYIFSLGLLSLFSLSLAHSTDVRSSNGTLGFDVDSDSQREAILSESGLGLGISPQEKLHVSGNVLVTGNVGIGGTANENAIHVHGTLSMTPKVSNGGEIDISQNSLVLVNTLSSDGAINLPDVAEASGRIYKIKKISKTGNLHFSASGNLIDNQVSFTIMEDDSASMPQLSLISDGSQWWILSYVGPTLEKSTAANLLIQYQLNETSGVTASDSSPNSRDGSLLNDFNFSGNTVTGVESTALQFVEPEEIVNYNQGSDLVTLGYSWSIWVNSAIDPDASPTFDIVNPTSDVLGFNWSSGNSIWRKSAFQQKNDGSYVHAQIPTDLEANTWYHIAATWDGSNLKAYLNGNLESTTSVSTLMGHSGNVTLNNPGSEPTSTTSLDDFQLFDRALTELEILTLFNSGSP
jgi:hypothetical protein